MRARLTKRTVETTQPESRDRYVWDTELRGFGLRIRPTGTKTYVLRYAAGRRGRTRWLAIGEHGLPWTAETARSKAEELRGAVALGEDPAAARDGRKAIPTLDVFATRYLAEHAEAHKRASSVAEDRRLLARVIIPRLGRHRLDRIARADVSALHHARRGTPVDANRALALLSKMLNVAEALGLREPGSNPCRGIPRYRELKRERFLSDAEMARLGAVLAEAEREGRESPFVLAAVRLLLFTGARLGEVLNARWADVDLAAGLLRILRPKEGRSKALRLGPPALEVLAKLPRIEGNPYVIVGRKDGGRFVGIQHVWQRVRLRAGLADVRLHDLRHSFASVAAAGGASLPIIGALLGHTQAATTQRYAHLSDDPLRAVAENVSMRIAAALRSDPEDKQDDANVLSLKRA